MQKTILFNTHSLFVDGNHNVVFFEEVVTLCPFPYSFIGKLRVFNGGPDEIHIFQQQASIEQLTKFSTYLDLDFLFNF